jgi:D-proline reductase (dithiol) PrdB
MKRLLRLKNRTLARVFTAFPALAERWGKGLEANREPIPWAIPRKPLREAALALVTTGGIHLKSQPPFDMGDPHGDPTYREIPTDTPREALAITHDYYDHRDAERDLGLVLPVAELRELAEAGALGTLHPVAYSFMGHIAGPHLETLAAKTAPEVARKLAEAGLDYALLVPA